MRTLFSSIADIYGPVSIQACRGLAEFTEKIEKARLKQIGSDVERYNDELKLTGMHWIDIFDLFPKLKNRVELKFVLLNTSRHHMRAYSISSAKDYVGDEIHLTVGRRVYT